MKKIFPFADGKTELSTLKSKGFSGILLNCSEAVNEAAKDAKKAGLEVWLTADFSQELPAEYICAPAGRVETESGTVKAVTADGFENALSKIKKELSECIEGFVLPIPDFDGLLWNDELAERCALDADSFSVLYDLFDEEKYISAVRSLYYVQAEGYVLSEFLIPVAKRAEKLGKKVSFDIGAAEMNTDLIRRLINPMRCAEAGLSLAVRGKKDFSEITAMLSGFSGNDSLLVTEKAEEQDCGGGDSVLLIIPQRGVLERYMRTADIYKARIETPWITAALDGVYYCAMLYEKGFKFGITDEFALENGGMADGCDFVLNGQRFGQILVCDSCSFSERGIEILSKAQEQGICINNVALIEVLQSELEEGE